MNAPRQTHFRADKEGDIELDLEGVVVPSSIPKPPNPQPAALPVKLQELVDRGDSRPQSKPTVPPPLKKPRVLPFLPHQGLSASRFLTSTLAKSRHSKDIKQITEMKRWAERVGRRKKGEASEEEQAEEEEQPPCKRPREEEVRKPRQSTSDLLMELEKEHTQRMREQAEATSVRLKVQPT